MKYARKEVNNKHILIPKSTQNVLRSPCFHAAVQRRQALVADQSHNKKDIINKSSVECKVSRHEHEWFSGTISAVNDGPSKKT